MNASRICIENGDVMGCIYTEYSLISSVSDIYELMSSNERRHCLFVNIMVRPMHAQLMNAGYVVFSGNIQCI